MPISKKGRNTVKREKSAWGNASTGQPTPFGPLSRLGVKIVGTRVRCMLLDRAVLQELRETYSVTGLCHVPCAAIAFQCEW